MRRICFAWFPALRGVLQMLEMQNSPHLQSRSLFGQKILPQACEPPTSIRHPRSSAYFSAASTSRFGCDFRDIGDQLNKEIRYRANGCQVTTTHLEKVRDISRPAALRHCSLAALIGQSQCPMLQAQTLMLKRRAISRNSYRGQDHASC